MHNGRTNQSILPLSIDNLFLSIHTLFYHWRLVHVRWRRWASGQPFDSALLLSPTLPPIILICFLLLFWRLVHVRWRRRASGQPIWLCPPALTVPTSHQSHRQLFLVLVSHGGLYHGDAQPLRGCWQPTLSGVLSLGNSGRGLESVPQDVDYRRWLSGTVINIDFFCFSTKGVKSAFSVAREKKRRKEVNSSMSVSCAVRPHFLFCYVALSDRP